MTFQQWILGMQPLPMSNEDNYAADPQSQPEKLGVSGNTQPHKSGNRAAKFG